MNDLKEKPSNVVPFQRASTSKDDGGSTGNWLRDMTQGTRFLASSNAENSAELIDFIVGSDPLVMPAVWLGRNINAPEGRFIFVRPDRFVRDYTFFMTLEVLEPKDGNNQIHTDKVERDAGVKKQPKVHARKKRIPPGDEPGTV